MAMALPMPRPAAETIATLLLSFIVNSKNLVEADNEPKAGRIASGIQFTYK
jgi:hypothetical protein